jgi:hypothetical protein
MDIKKINLIRRNLSDKQKKYTLEKDYKKKQILGLWIQIDRLKLRIEGLK